MPSPRLHEHLVEDTIDQVRAGTNVVLTGLPGSGRTAVLRRVGDLLDDAGYRVLRLRGVRALRDRPLEALAVSALGADRPGRGASLLATYVAAIGASSASGRLAVVVDDADDLDLESVGALAAAWANHPFAVVASTRVEAGPSERSLADAVGPVVRFTVPALTYDETTAIVEELLGGQVEAATAGRLHAKAGGMPGLVAAVVRSARHEGRLVPVDGAWRARGGLWTPLVGPTVERLLADLDPGARHAVRVLALTGPLRPATARRLIDWGVLEELDRHGLLQTVGRGASSLVGLYPPLVGEQYRHGERPVLQQRVSEKIRTALGVADPLLAEDSGAGLEQSRRLAQDVCTAMGRERATVLDRYLADHVVRERVLRRAEWEQDPVPATAVRYLETLLMVGFDPGEAERVVARTPEHGDPLAVAHLRGLDAIRLATVPDGLDAARATLRRPLLPEMADAGVGPVLHAMERRLTLTVSHRPDGDLPVPTEGPARDVAGVVVAETMLAAGRTDDAVAQLDAVIGPAADGAEARGSEAELQDVRTARSAAVDRGIALVLEGRVEAALAWSSSHLDEAIAVHDIDGLWAHGYVRTVALALLGRFAELRDHVGVVLAVGLIPLRWAHLATGTLALAAYVALREGRLDAARSFARQAKAVAPAPGPWPFTSVGWFDGVVAGHEAGRPQEKADAFWEEALRLEERGYTVAAAVMGVISLESDPDHARAEHLLSLLQDVQGAGGRGLGALASAAVSTSAEPALALYRDASGRGIPLLAARALGHAMRLLRAAGDDHGADGLRARAMSDGLPRDLLATMGDPASRLTVRERQVVGLVEDGLSNQQVAHRLRIAVSTVENHLHHAYRKLDVPGRDALVARASSSRR